jgi:hypothetical protein
MNPIRSAVKVIRPEKSEKKFTYVMDSTLWECTSCGERVAYLAKRNHSKRCLGDDASGH